MDPSKYTSIDQCLRDLIPWNEAYRNSQPIVSDAVYDVVWDKLEELVEASEMFGGGADPEVMRGRAFLNKIGAPPPVNSPWVKVAHTVPMLSLNKARNPVEFAKWMLDRAAQQSVLTPRYIVSDKCDGISLRMTYEDGKLVRAVTRGDDDDVSGQQIGEDITRNVVKMKGVKTFIKGFTGQIRNEIVMTNSDWKQHFPEYSNPRNGAGGKAKDQGGDRCEHLTVLSYEIVREDGNPIPSKQAQYKIMGALGLIVPNWYECNTEAEILAIYEEYVNGKRASLDYDIDGLVVEFSDPAVVERMGVRGRGPDAAVAIKFPAETGDSPLEDLAWQVGGTGVITPVAVFEPVLLVGANVGRASLASMDILEGLLKPSGRHAFAKGDVVRVSRRGDVIPKVEALIKPNPNPTVWFEPPTKCPSCGEPLTRKGAHLICTYEDCPAQYAGSMSRWVDKLGVKEWGDSIILAIYDAGMAKDPADLYLLDEAKVAALTMGDSGVRVGARAGIALRNLKAQMSLPLHVFVGALGIPMMARSMCQKLVDAGYDTLDKMQDAGNPANAPLSSVPGMGQAKAQSFIDGMAKRRDLIARLLKAGVVIRPPNRGVLKGITFCFTGIRDDDMEKRIEANGGTVKGSASRDLTFLVAKDPNAKSGKLDKARQNGTTILGIEDAWDILGGR